MNRKLVYALISLIIFLGILLIILFGTFPLDTSISNSLDKINKGFFEGFFLFLAKYADVIMVAITVMFLGIFVSTKKKTNRWILIISLGSGYIIEKIIKLILERPRPSLQLIQDLENSFPSGHATLSIILFSLIIYFYKDEIKNKTKKLWFIAMNIFLILLIGFSRLYANVHWLSDVLGGFALGFCIFNLILFLFEKKKRF